MVSLHSTTNLLLVFQSISIVDSFVPTSRIACASHTNPRHEVCLFSSSTHHTSRPKSKEPNKNKEANDNVRPTARFVAAAALASGSKDDANSSAFAARRLEQDERYRQLEPRDRAFARLLVVRYVFLFNLIFSNNDD